MVKIRQLRRQDVDYVLQNTKREQWGHTKRDIERCLQYEPNGCFIAEHENQKVGHVFTVNYDKLGWIGLLIVNPEHRGKGIGTQLMKKAIQYLEKKGTKTIGLDAEQKAAPLYERLGFKKAYDSLRFTKQTQKHTWIPTQTKNILPLKRNDLKTLTKFDAKIFGANRTRILQSLHDDYAEYCWIAKRNQKTLGYIINRKDDNVCRIGPWVCRPKHIETAKALLETCIETVNENSIEVHVGVLAANLDAVALVESMGFVQRPRSIRMFKGETAPKGDTLGVYGIVAPETG
ncbi:MAG: GNAT family N-acetyltransferase [Candidatus Bathyarchaeia archaeon]|jgi:predicted N-acetyltransferase YhbS|nr:GNAT family N-acetyltransferase [Candidatus Bathyarchaeota archaeon A05DMB-4]MDH7595145.1 GNAT family N-acetyltransferase [Candidatus Bathyarchaeota archaeon]